MIAVAQSDQLTRDALDAARMLAGCYDERLLRSDHVLDDLFDRGLLVLATDCEGEWMTALTREGRQLVLRLLSHDQDAREAAELRNSGDVADSLSRSGRNHAPWCSDAHVGPCRAENEPSPDRCDVIVYEGRAGWHWRLVRNGRTVEASKGTHVSKASAQIVAEYRARCRAESDEERR